MSRRIKSIKKKNIIKFNDKVLKKLLSKGLDVKLNIKESTIEFGSDDAYLELKSADVIEAIASGGVDYRVASKLFSENYMLRIIDLEEYYSKERDLRRVMGRIIGSGGRTKLIIEEITETDIYITDDYKIYIIGSVEGVNLAIEAIEALMRGSPHKKVYRLLESKRRYIKESNMRLWKDRSGE